MAQTLPGVAVYRGAYASAYVLGDVVVYVEPDGVVVVDIAGRLWAFQYPWEYGTIEHTYPDVAAVFADGVVWPEWVRPMFEPVGEFLFGERRVVFRV